MFNLQQAGIAFILALVGFATTNACHSASKVTATGASAESASQYSWAKVADAAAFPGGYNFPVFVMQNEMWAFHPQGNWRSPDGKTWTKSELPLTGLNSAYQKYVQLGDSVYALGAMEGNYLNMRLSSRIMRTKDFKRWEVLAEETNLPARVFYGALVFDNKIWLMGGFDGQTYYNDVWNSTDGVRWTRVSERAAWSERNISGATVVFKDRMWIIGGGVIDGTPMKNEKAGSEIWSSADGVNWVRESESIKPAWGGSPVVFDGKLWLVGANRDGSFTRAVLSTNDGVTWREETAPWSPRGAAAVWVFDNKLYMTGGKYSETVNNQLKFVYRNDVWSMTAASRNVALLR